MKTIHFLFTTLFSVFIISCNDCSQFESESYLENEMKIEDLAKDNLRTLYSYLGEPDLETSTHESYRLLVGAAHSQEKKVIRIDHKEQTYTLSYKVFKAKATPSQDIEVDIIEQNTYNLSEKEWKGFISTVYKTKYWTMPEKTEKSGYKGVTYFIEGARPQAKACNKRTQHMTTRWNPSGWNYLTLCTSIENLEIKKRKG